MRPLYASVVAAVAFGALLGIGTYTFVYAQGASYLTNDPAACANCHVMTDHYHAWSRSSHRAAAVCNDCHTPPGAVAKYVTKSRNGFWHSFAFTTGRYPDPLRITARNREIAETACRTCHAELTASIGGVPHGRTGGTLACVTCHRDVGHLE